MGYTHYWYQHEHANTTHPEAFGRTLLDAQQLFRRAAELGYDLAGPMGEGDPELAEGYVAFNGRDEQSYETFRFDAKPERPAWVDDKDDDPWFFACCKIGFMDPDSFRAYGDVVEAFLIRAKHHYGEAMRVASDGTWDNYGERSWGHWAKGRDLYELAFGEVPERPWSDDEVDA